LITIFTLSACQLTEQCHHQEQNNNVAEYYLWLKTLDKAQLAEEFILQQQKEQAGLQQARLNLALIFTLPDTITHNAYSAKTKLNSYQKQVTNPLSVNDLAFVTLLKDQLNQQLFLYQQLVEQEKRQQKLQRNINEKKQEISKLIIQVDQLKKQISQLKKIEKIIQQRGQ
jgi:hypothetical protein